MEAATRLSRFNASSAWLSLPIASAAEWTIPVLKGRTIAGQPDLPNGAAESGHVARRVRARSSLSQSNYWMPLLHDSAQP